MISILNVVYCLKLLIISTIFIYTLILFIIRILDNKKKKYL